MLVQLVIMVNIELFLITRTWFVFWRVFLRALLGKAGRNRMLTANPEINSLTRGWYPFLCSDGVLIVPVDSHPLLKEVYKDDIYESSRIRKNDVAVDVGAHVGIFTLKAARKAKLVISVEPYPLNFRLLLTNVRINRLTNVIPVNSALGSCNGEANLSISLKSDSHTIRDSLKNQPQVPISSGKQRLTVKLRTLDSLVNEFGIDKVGYIKIDAEGAELDILKGASNTLNNAETEVAVACYHWPEETTKVNDFLRATGFTTIESSKGILKGSKN